tara:strand:- start:866 stop:1348 length:483 start_codon:yes stop_codon:yes gene_type:complete
MSVEIKGNITGLKDLEKALLALNKEYSGKAAAQALRPAIKAAVAPLETPIRNATPIDSGDLRDSTKVKVGKPNKKMASSEYYTKDTVIYGQVGWFWKGSPSLWHQALAVEFGTRDNPAQSILRDTFDANSDEMLNKFKSTLGPAIEKKAKALAKKQLKSK